MNSEQIPMKAHLSSVFTSENKTSSAKLNKDSFPARFGGIHFVNQPWYIHALYTVIRPFLKEKTRKRIFLHGNNLNSLHQLIHPEILPSEFGGMLPPYDMGTWARTLLDHEYDDDSEYNVDSYSMPVKEVEKELSPKSMKRYVPIDWEVDFCLFPSTASHFPPPPQIKSLFLISSKSNQGSLTCGKSKDHPPPSRSSKLIMQRLCLAYCYLGFVHAATTTVNSYDLNSCFAADNHFAERSQSVVDPTALKRMDKNEEENRQPLLSLD
ncbi:Clavesin-2 [Microtus ochrogaster]|uniref:Clavesin-2 n=1 Tax=Microtus ochrogaster TaxID=79684 RepID=A0A8J6GQK0_MICOH|nr:Clavesin-2 [Microtus ochrogaster]